MSITEILQEPIAFDLYIEQQRAQLALFCRPYFEKVQAAVNEGSPHCDFSLRNETHVPFPWTLLASELMLRFPQYKTSIVTRYYDPGECELYVDSYTVRIFASKKQTETAAE